MVGQTWQHVRKTLCRAREAKDLVRLLGLRVEKKTKTRYNSPEQLNSVGSRINTVRKGPSLKIALYLYCKVNCKKRLATCKLENSHGHPGRPCSSSYFSFFPHELNAFKFQPYPFQSKISVCHAQKENRSEIQWAHTPR